jgi:DNA-binding LacI/PurR family transcriptional regulator
MINIDNIAVKSKVSKATVARASNGKTVVSLNAREKMLAALQQLFNQIKGREILKTISKN